MAIWRAVLRFFASIRLTVALLTLAMVLIFVGTLAQVNLGIWQTVEAYFRSPVAWVDLQLFVPRQVATIPWMVPFPGGLTIGLLLLINLLAAHAVRFKMEKKRIGLLLLHAGIIVLLLGEFVTAIAADEGLMSIDEGRSANYVEDIREVELAVIDPSDDQVDHVTAVPERKLKEAIRSGRPLQHEAMP